MNDLIFPAMQTWMNVKKMSTTAAQMRIASTRLGRTRVGAMTALMETGLRASVSSKSVMSLHVYPFVVSHTIIKRPMKPPTDCGSAWKQE